MQQTYTIHTRAYTHVFFIYFKAHSVNNTRTHATNYYCWKFLLTSYYFPFHSWMYRIKPSVMHAPYTKKDKDSHQVVGDFSKQTVNPNQVNACLYIMHNQRPTVCCVRLFPLLYTRVSKPVFYPHAATVASDRYS
jgi:hypothetical protein